ncbi:MAG: SRPBCC family protein [Pseudomonadota bacterium]
MGKAKKKETINVSMEKLFNIIIDYEKYSEFVPFVDKVVIEKSQKNKKVVTFSLNLIKKINYTLELTEKPNYKVSWTLVKGDLMKLNNGGWDLKEISKDKCEATYSIELNFGLLVPKKISEMLASKNLPETLEAFKNRAEGI